MAFKEAPHQAIAEAEKKIQSILLDLVNDHGIDVDVVDVDTRNFMNYRTEIFQRIPARANRR